MDGSIIETIARAIRYLKVVVSSILLSFRARNILLMIVKIRLTKEFLWGRFKSFAGAPIAVYIVPPCNPGEVLSGWARDRKIMPPCRPVGPIGSLCRTARAGRGNLHGV